MNVLSIVANVKNKNSMELENKIKCILMDFEINKITLQETTDKILALYNVVGRSEQLLFSPDDIERIIDEKSQFSGMQFRRYFEEK